MTLLKLQEDVVMRSVIIWMEQQRSTGLECVLKETHLNILRGLWCFREASGKNAFVINPG